MEADGSENEGGAVPVVCGLIGYGTLAQQLVTAFVGEKIKWVILVRQPLQTSAHNISFITQWDDFLRARPRLVIEVASQQAVADYLPFILEAGIPAIIASVGALAEPIIVSRLAAAQRQSGASLILPSGAIGGLDYLEAIRILPDASVSYTSRKPVAAWRQELVNKGIQTPSEEIVLFEGTPEMAARLYPQNLNAAFAIALTIQPIPLTVRVVADPRAQSNIHEIEVKSAAGHACLRFDNAPSPDNPKSSMVTSLSLAASMRRLLNAVGAS